MKKSNFILLILFFWMYCPGQDSIHQEEISTGTEEEFEDEYADYETYTPTPTKDERGETYFEQRKLDSKFKDQYKGDKYDYDRPEKRPKEKIDLPSPPVVTLPNGLLQILMYGILFLIIATVIYFVFKNAGGFRFGNPRNKINLISSEQSSENLDDITQNNFAKLIESAKETKDFRKAVRYYYLWILQKLTDKNLIIWHKEKTDYDYFLELSQNEIQQDFYQNTYVYDHAWYGNFQLTKKEFDVAEKLFLRTIEKIN